MNEKQREIHKKYLSYLSNTNYNELYPKKWERFKNCSSELKMSTKCKCGYDLKVYFNRCKLPFCPMCANIQSGNKYKEALLISRFLQWDKWKKEQKKLFLFFLTFTIKTGFDLKHQIKKLMDGLRSVKQENAYWQRYCYAGFQSIEATMSRGLWHAHAHLLVLSELDWIDPKDLEKLKAYWYKKTKGKNVHADRIYDLNDSKDVFKYALKPDQKIRKEKLYEFAVNTSDIKLYTKIGKAYNYGKNNVLDLKKALGQEVSNIYDECVGDSHVCPECMEPAKWDIYQPKPPLETIKRKNQNGVRQYIAVDEDGDEVREPLNQAERKILEEYDLPHQMAKSIITAKKLKKMPIQSLVDLKVKHQEFF